MEANPNAPRMHDNCAVTGQVTEVALETGLLIPEDLKDRIEERVAIMTYLAGLPSAEAEALAAVDSYAALATQAKQTEDRSPPGVND